MEKNTITSVVDSAGKKLFGPGFIEREGRITFSDGSILEGEFQYCMLHGQGKIMHSMGLVLEGEFYQGLLHGHGKVTWPWGSVYEGEFVRGLPRGQGTMTLADGTAHEGEYTMGGYAARRFLDLYCFIFFRRAKFARV